MNEKSKSDSYAAAGVDITAGYKAVELMKKHIARTVTQNSSADIGGFGGLFALDLTGYKNPVLVSGTDGVGTKLKIALNKPIIAPNPTKISRITAPTPTINGTTYTIK